jgi:hypothetical protein
VTYPTSIYIKKGRSLLPEHKRRKIRMEGGRMDRAESKIDQFSVYLKSTLPYAGT